MDEIIQAVSAVGFPIFMALLLFWYMTQQAENHRAESDSIKDAINELKIAITTLINKLES